MRTPTDALRSVAVYMSESLGDDWEVRFEDEEGAFERPFCRVQTATGVTTRVQNMHVADCLQTFAVVCYPAETATPAQARLEAGRVEELLHQAFAVGVHESAYGRKQGFGVPDQSYQRAHPMRIPLYDFDDVGVYEVVDDENRDLRDFLAIDDPPVFQTLEGTSRAEEEETLYVVTGEFRVKWTRSSAVITDATPVESVTATPDPS